MDILVVDDDNAVRDSLRRSLQFNGYDVGVASDGCEALELIRSSFPRLIILDVLMEEMNGLELCRELRSSGFDRPVLMLTVRGNVADRVAGLDAGADDYLPKPFALEELMARVRSLLRRSAIDSYEEPISSTLEFEDLFMDLESRDVTRAGRPLRLTRTEFNLLHQLLSNPRRVLTRRFLLQEVWGSEFRESGNGLEVYIGYLRKKTEEGGESRLIQTVRGVGYVLREEAP